jgi:hypothetical protein
MLWHIGVVAISAVAAMSQDNAMQFVVSSPVSALQPWCTVEVRAAWDAEQELFAVAVFDVIAGSDVGGFIAPELLLDAAGTEPGEVAPDGDSVTGIASGRFYCWPEICCDFTGCNPERLWRVTWRTKNFTPRLIDLHTVTSRFELYIDEHISASFLDSLEEAVGQIVVTCYADCDQDTGLGEVDLFDFLCFVNKFNQSEEYADCDANGVWDLFDFLCFVNQFNEGC